MKTLDQLKKLIQGSAILGALIADGSIQVVYKHPPKVDESLLFRTWSIEVLIVDDYFSDQVVRALQGLGFEVVSKRDRISATIDTAITDDEREAFREAEAREKAAKKEEKAAAKDRATSLQIDQLQGAVDELREQVEYSSLIRPEGKAGPAGRPGRDGRDGRDIDATETKLTDLQDVGAGFPRQGQILMWQEISQSWEFRYPPQTPTSIGGGGGGSGSGGGDIDIEEISGGVYGSEVGPTPPEGTLASGRAVVSESAPTTQEDGSPLVDGVQWYRPSTNLISVWHDGDWRETANGGNSPTSRAVTINPSENYSEIVITYDPVTDTVSGIPIEESVLVKSLISRIEALESEKVVGLE